MPTGCPLDPATVVAVDAEPLWYRELRDSWHDQSVVRELDDAVHHLELARAAVPPVIEVTVTAPPGGISRDELGAAVSGAVARLGEPRRPRVRASGRKIAEYLLGDPLPGPAVLPPGMTPEDLGSDHPTNPTPVVREVRVP